MTKKLKCYMCGGGDDDCEASVNEASVICEGASLVRLKFHPNNSTLIFSALFVLLICFVCLFDFIQCWKMMVRETGGARGCVTNREQESFYCNRHKGNETGPRAGQHHTVCCRENLCNDGPFPVLADSSPGEMGLIVWSLCIF